MTEEMLYVFGQPGSGKTTLINALTEGTFGSTFRQPFTCTEYINGVVQLGVQRPGGFGGTDALAMSVQPKVLRWLEEERPPFVLGEGDRLTNRKFFQAVTDLGISLYTVYLYVPDELAAKRREGRGSNQNATWIKGRQTKIINLTNEWPVSNVIRGDLPLAEQVRRLRRMPVGERF